MFEGISALADILTGEENMSVHSEDRDTPVLEVDEGSNEDLSQIGSLPTLVDSRAIGETNSYQELQDQLAAVNSSVMALVNPYEDNSSYMSKVKEETEET